jgi:sugar (pentulose or hexulose) kinase
MKILAVDVGTTSLKMGIYSLTHRSLEMVRQFSKTYDINIYNGAVFSEISSRKNGSRHSLPDADHSKILTLMSKSLRFPVRLRG